MGIFNAFRVQIVLRALLLAATSLSLGVLIAFTSLYELWVVAALALVYQVVGFIRYGERTANEVTRFLEAIRYEDFSVSFRPAGRGVVFERLSEAFADVTAAFRRVRAEREEHSRYLEHVVQQVRVALLCFRADGEVRFMNASAKRLLRLGRLRQIQDLDEVSQTLATSLLQRTGDGADLVRFERGGRLFQLSISTSRFRMGQDVFVLASLQDIGSALDEKEMEAWQKLTRVLTHEIMNSVAPIASLASTVGALLEHERNGRAQEQIAADVREAVQIIERRSEGLIRFVDAYRSLTRIPAPQLEFVSARALIDRVLRLLQSQMRAKSIACRVDVEPDDLVLTADPNLIEQVLINLLLNAIDAVDSVAAPRIELRARKDERGLAGIEVSDNGMGISPDVHEHLFVPFYTTKEHGSGIGLSLSRQIMRAHGGTLRVESAPGGGSRFMLGF